MGGRGREEMGKRGGGGGGGEAVGVVGVGEAKGVNAVGTHFIFVDRNTMH